MRNKYLLSISLILCLAFGLKAQNEANVWWFGTEWGLDFNTTPPTNITDRPINTYEGSATICDPATGALIFATDGRTVWYPNGTTVVGGTGLRGSFSSAQSALIIPDPSNANRWYLFTSNVDPGTDTPQGTNYYVVTRAGAVITVSGATNLLGASASTEQLCALGDGSGGYWVVTHGTDGSMAGAGAGSNTFYAYRISNTGVLTTTPVTSNAGYSMKHYQGSMKPNTCQTQIAATYMTGGRTEVYNFNNATGQVTGVACSITGLTNPYGLEFSPNDLYLYHGTLAGTIYKLTIAGCANANTGWAYPPNGIARVGQMQLAPDGKIYVTNECTAGTCYLGVISNPNGGAGAEAYSSTGLAGPVPTILGYPQLGLPTFSRTFVSGVLEVFPGDGTYCVNTGVPLSYTFSGNVTSQTWSVSPGTGWSFTSGTATSAAPTITFTSTGTYTVTLDVVSCGRTYTETMDFNITNPATPAGTVTCSGNDLILDNPAADPNEPRYIWYKNSVAAANIIGYGTPYTYNVGSNSALPTQICLGVAASGSSMSTGSGSIGPTAASLGWAGNGSPYTSHAIGVLSDVLVLKSFDIKLWACPGSGIVNVVVRNGGGTTIYNQNVTLAACVGAGQTYTIPVNTTLQAGTNYTIVLTAAGASFMGGTWSGGVNAGQISYAAEVSAGTTSIANIQYDYKDFNVTTVCSTPTCIPVACTLPVEWSNFTVRRSGSNSAVLNWITLSEINNDHFVIERSLNGTDFITIGTIAGKGNYVGTTNYEFIDEAAPATIAYYRIKQVDIDGQNSYSPIKSIEALDGNLVIVYPNPSASSFTVLSNYEGALTLNVYDVLGRLVYNATAGRQTTFGEDLAKGTYILKIQSAGSVQTIKIEKQ